MHDVVWIKRESGALWGRVTYELGVDIIVVSVQSICLSSQAPAYQERDLDCLEVGGHEGEEAELPRVCRGIGELCQGLRHAQNSTFQIYICRSLNFEPDDFGFLFVLVTSFIFYQQASHLQAEERRTYPPQAAVFFAVFSLVISQALKLWFCAWLS